MFDDFYDAPSGAVLVSSDDDDTGSGTVEPAAMALAPAAAAVSGGSPNPKQADGKMPHFTHAG